MKRIGFWNKLGILMMLLTATPALATELVVFKAEGISLKPGETINASQPLTLTIGQRVTLLASNGTILNLEGPFHDKPLAKNTKSSDSGVVNTLKMLVSAPKTRSGELGTTRSVDQAILHAQKNTLLPEPWLVDVTRSGNYCLMADKPLVFWRPASQENATMSVQLGNEQWKAHAQWPAGSNRLIPPAIMPVSDGAVYQLELNGITSTAKLHIMPKSITNQNAQANWLQNKGCITQMAALNKITAL